MSATMAGSLPQGDANGLAIPTARIRRIEAIKDPEDGRKMRALLRREWERRTGKTVLPFEMEEEMRAAFGEDDGGTKK